MQKDLYDFFKYTIIHIIVKRCKHFSYFFQEIYDENVHLGSGLTIVFPVAVGSDIFFITIFKSFSADPAFPIIQAR